VHISPDARFIISQDESQNVLRFNETRTGKEFGRIATSGALRIFSGPPSFMMPDQSVFSGDGRYLAIPGPTGSVQLVDLSRAFRPLQLDVAYKRPAILSRDRRLLSLSDYAHVVRVHDMETGKVVGTLGHDEPTLPVHISLDGRLLLSEQKSILKLNVIETGLEAARREQSWDSSIQVGPNDAHLKIYNYGQNHGQLVALTSLQEILRYPTGEVCGPPTFSPDGSSFAITNRSLHTVNVFDTATGAERLRIEETSNGSWPSWAYTGPCDPTFSPDGQSLAVDMFGTVKIYDLASGAEKSAVTYQWPPNARTSLSSTFSPDGTLMVVKGFHLELHDLLSGRKLARVQVPSENDSTPSLGRYLFNFSGDSRFLAAGSTEGDPVRLFEARTGEELKSVELGRGFAGVLFSPDGRTLAAASTNGSVRLLDVESRKVIGIGQHAKAVMHMEFSPDSRYLATASEDGTALLLATRPGIDGSVGREIARFEHGASLLRANFSREGRSLLTVSDDRVKLWPADPEWPFEQLCARAGRNLTREEWRTLIGESVPWKATCAQWHTPEADASAADAASGGSEKIK
jgi:WD40 repeat protein